jgi:hypothetical protein
MLEDRRRSIRSTLKAIDEKLRAVQANSASVEEALYQKLQVCSMMSTTGATESQK